MSAEKFKWEQVAEPKYCVTFMSSEEALMPCVVDVYDLENGVRAQRLPCETPTPEHMFGSDVWGDIVFAAGGSGGATVRVFSIADGEQKGNWKGVAEQNLYSCTLMETPSLIGAAGTYNGQELRLFDINTCKPCAKINGSYEDNACWMVADPVNRASFFLLSADGKIHQYDARAKKHQRVLIGNYGGWPSNVSFPPTSGGKFTTGACSGINVFDSNTGKVLWHGMPKGNIVSNLCAAITSNLLVIGAESHLWFFDTNKLVSEKELDFDKADYDISVPGCTMYLGAGLKKIYVVTSNGIMTLSNPSL